MNSSRRDNDQPDLREWARTSTTWDPEEATTEADGRPDVTMVPYVEALLADGVRTYQSCAGHVREYRERMVEEPGALWFTHPAFSPTRAVDSGEFEQVARLWGREEHPVWEVTFLGLTESPESLHGAMDALWYSLDLDTSPPKPEEE